MKKRILFIVPLPPPIHGASLRNQSLINSALLNSVFNIDIIPIQFIKDNQEMGKFSLLKIYKAFRLFFSVVKSVLKHKPNLVYLNMATFGFALYRDSIIVLLTKFLNKPIAIHLRTQKIKEQAENSRFKNWMFKFTFKNTSIICLSNNLSNDVRTVYHEKIHIVNNGIELFDTKNINIEERTNNKVRFLFLSNLLKTKGVFDLIEATAQLSKITQDFEVWIVGKNADLTIHDVCDHIAKHHLEGTVKVFEAVYNDEKIKKYLETDVFILPTHFEAFPGVILEAMQMGLPIISTQEGAIPEIVDHMKNGIIISKKNTIQLANAMNYFINNKSEIETFGERAKVKFYDNYVKQKFERKMEETYN